MAIVEKRNALRCAPIEMSGQFGQDHLGDEGHIKPAYSVECYPMQMTQFIFGPAEIIGIIAQRGRVDQEKPRIEPAGATGGRDRTKQEAGGFPIR